MPDPENTLKPNADEPKGPGTNETKPAESAAHQSDFAHLGEKLQQDEDAKRAADRKRIADDEKHKREALTHNTREEAEAKEDTSSEATPEPEKKEAPAQTLKNWRAP